MAWETRTVKTVTLKRLIRTTELSLFTKTRSEFQTLQYGCIINLKNCTKYREIMHFRDTG